METDKIKEIVNYINDNETIYITGKRYRKVQSNVDKRTYIVFILIVKHGLSYENVAEIFKFHRTTCYDILRKVGYMLKDKAFNLNTFELQEIFPYTEEDVIRLHTILRNKREVKRYKKRQLSNENVFTLTVEDVIKLKNNPFVIRTIKNIIKMS